MAAKKITKLTASQEADLAESIRYWLAIGRSTEPLDRQQVTESISAMYQAIGKQPPVVMFFSSPAMCVLAWGAMRGSQLGLQLESQLESQLRSQLESQLGLQPGLQLESQLESQLGSQLGSQLRSQLESQLRLQLRSQLGNYYGGAHQCAWGVFYDFCNRIGVDYTNEQKAILQLWISQSRHCHWWFPYDGIVLASERPVTLNIDAQGRLHSKTQAAIAYRDGWGIHAVNGVRVPEYIIERPSEITISVIDSEQNAEIRRVMIERYGQARYIVDSGAECVHSLPGNYYVRGLQDAKLYRKHRSGDTSLVMICVKNSTPEPDGSVRDYFLRVDPAAYDGLASRDCHAAMASTWRNPDGSLFYRRPTEYAPRVES